MYLINNEVYMAWGKVKVLPMCLGRTPDVLTATAVLNREAMTDASRGVTEGNPRNI